MSQLGHALSIPHTLLTDWRRHKPPQFELTVTLLQVDDWGRDATHENAAVVDLRLEAEKSDAKAPQREEASKHAPCAKISVRVRVPSCDTVGTEALRAVLVPHVIHACNPYSAVLPIMHSCACICPCDDVQCNPQQLGHVQPLFMEER